jgi:universal stress protein A
MENYKNILCAVDFSELSDAAALRAASLARQTGAHFTLLHVVEYFPENRSNEIIAPECTDPAEYRENEARKGLFEQANRLAYKEARLEVLFTPHSAWHEIISFAGANNIDLIVLGCHGHHGIARLVGSTANGVLNHAPCDVLAIRPRS